MATLTDKLENTIRSLAVKATQSMRGILTRSLARPIDPNGIIGHLDINVVRSGNIITAATDFPDYAYWVDKGRRSGKMPPEQPIKDWVKKHNIAESAVFPIRRKIGREGTEATNFTTPLQRMVEMIRKTVSMNAVTYIQDNVYQSAKTIGDITVKL